jgi:hypothetical protein
MQVQCHDEDYNKEEMAIFDKPVDGYSIFKHVANASIDYNEEDMVFAGSIFNDDDEVDDDTVHNDEDDEVDEVDDGYGLAQFFEDALH